MKYIIFFLFACLIGSRAFAQTVDLQGKHYDIVIVYEKSYQFAGASFSSKEMVLKKIKETRFENPLMIQWVATGGLEASRQRIEARAAELRTYLKNAKVKLFEAQVGNEVFYK